MKNLEIISLGLGVQSTTMYYMSSLGILPRADYAIFADTGGEKKATLYYLKYLRQWCKENNGIPIIVVRERNLYRDLLATDQYKVEKFGVLPSFTKNDNGSVGMLRRQCTGEYKIFQVDHAIRKLYGLKPKQRNIPTTIWKGITLDEVERASVPLKTEKWKTFYYPFIQLKVGFNSHEWDSSMEKMYRSHCIEWLIDNNLPVPEKSSCIFCPYMSDVAWLNMKNNSPGDFKRAVTVDKAIRDSTKKGIEKPVYLHRSCKPLDKVVFDENQLDFWGECSGNCHI